MAAGTEKYANREVDTARGPRLMGVMFGRLDVALCVLMGLALSAGLGGCGSKAASGSDCTDCAGVCVENVCVIDEDVSEDAPDVAEDATLDVAEDADADDAADAASDSAGIDVEARDTPQSDHTLLCSECTTDAACGAGVCLGSASGAWCATPCGAGDPCPDSFDCLAISAGGDVARVCVPESGACEACTDVDNDGFSVGAGCGEVDCAPNDPAIFPGATELCDGADNDCDRRVDEGIALDSDPMNCGACGVVCAADQMEMACTRGSCVAVACSEGWIDCDGAIDTGCETPASEANTCGGCSAITETIGAACGTCDTGAWVCTSAESVVCSGDRGASALNACGGCGVLDGGPGVPCGPCGRGSWVCEGGDALRCALPADAAEWATCGDTCCGPGSVCVGGVCGAEVDCNGPADCFDDTFCDVASGACVPWDGQEPPFDTACERVVTVAQFAPQLQCVWDEAPAGPYQNWVHVLSTPMVGDFNLDNDAGVIRPSIVFTTDDGDDGGSELPTGLIRLIDGRTCETQFTLDMQLTSHSSPPAIGDLDGDGTPEIVAYKANGGLVAFRYDRAANTWGVLWRSTLPSGDAYEPRGAGWGGPGIHDLNDDGIPEVLRGAIVFDANGVLIDDSLGNVAAGSSPANMSFVTDMDGDGAVELATGDGVWEWDVVAETWVPEPWFTGTSTRGYVAIADLGDFGTPGLTGILPEVAVVKTGAVRVQTLGGEIVFGPVAIPGGGTGGPPTIGDFDGDGRAEVAAAGRGSYTVFDLDCRETGAVGTCASGRTDGILWTRTAQDFSSSQTGSSIFDFEGDGRAEAVYADECFVRVYDGETGDVVFSQYRSSCTWNENPVVADADGDFNSELIVPSNRNCGTTCSGLEPGQVDPQFEGLRCTENSECLSGVCDAGLCRCTDVDQCCAGDCASFGFVCTAPPAGTPGTGSTCRAAHPTSAQGIRVYSDGLDQWVNSRPIWNQHAYAVTHVNSNGTIPRTSDVRPNWSVSGLNNFRQNVQGDLEVLQAPDLTSRGSGATIYCDASGSLTLEALVCNRGTEGLDLGVGVSFYAGDPAVDGEEICTQATTTVLGPGDCEPVACVWPTPPRTGAGVDVFVVPDGEGGNRECVEGNNTARIPNVVCD